MARGVAEVAGTGYIYVTVRAVLRSGCHKLRTEPQKMASRKKEARRFLVDPATLRGYREHRLLTQEELADRIGCTNTQISDWERGVRVPSLRRLRQLKRELEIPDEEISLHRSSPASSSEDGEDPLHARAA